MTALGCAGVQVKPREPALCQVALAAARLESAPGVLFTKEQDEDFHKGGRIPLVAAVWKNACKGDRNVEEQCSDDEFAVVPLDALKPAEPFFYVVIYDRAWADGSWSFMITKDMAPGWKTRPFVPPQAGEVQKIGGRYVAVAGEQVRHSMANFFTPECP